jgi:hypothetical protein
MKGCPEFTGMKVSIESRACRQWGIYHLRCFKTTDVIELKRLGTVGWGGNGGFNAFNMAVQLEPAKIILVGCDASIKNGLHWHGAHTGAYNPREHQVERWRRAFDGAAKEVAELGIPVINCSPVSALRNYPKMTFAEALAS